MECVALKWSVCDVEVERECVGLKYVKVERVCDVEMERVMSKWREWVMSK